MPQFKELGFTFNNIRSSDLGYYIVNATDSNDNLLGLKKTIKEEDNNQSTKAFYGISLEEFEFEIDICKSKPNYEVGELEKITENDLRFLNKWLIMPREYKVFSSDQNRDIYYYAMFTGVQEKDFGTVNYLTLTMRLNAGFSYSAVMHHQYTVTGSKTFDILTKSNVDEYIYPDITIKTMGNVLVNGNPKPNHLDGWYVAGGASWFTQYEDIGIANVNNYEAYAYSPTSRVKPNTKYTFKGYMMIENNVASGQVYAIGMDETGKEVWWSLLVQVNEKHEWKDMRANFTTPENVKYLKIRIDNEGCSDASQGFYCVFFKELQIVEGDTPKDHWVDSSIRITNNTLGETMELKNLPSGYRFECYSEDMKLIKCLDDEMMNMRPHFNKTWLRLLGDSTNNITIEGECEIDIYFQNKIAIQH